MATTRASQTSRGLSDGDYKALAEFRHLLRRFLAFSESAAEGEGLAAQQHQALLAIKASESSGGMGVGALASHLVIRSNSAVGLVDRLDKLGLVRRGSDKTDRRRVTLLLTAKAEATLARLTASHREELQRIAPTMKAILKDISGASR